MAVNKKLVKALEEAKEDLNNSKNGKELKELRKQVKELEQYKLKLQDMLLKAENEAEQYKQLYNDSLLKLEECQNKINFNTHDGKAGRKRKSSISDDDIIAMSQCGKSLRMINKETGLSINTIRDILKGVSK